MKSPSFSGYSVGRSCDLVLRPLNAEKTVALLAVFAHFNERVWGIECGRHEALCKANNRNLGNL